MDLPHFMSKNFMTEVSYIKHVESYDSGYVRVEAYNNYSDLTKSVMDDMRAFTGRSFFGRQIPNRRLFSIPLYRQIEDAYFKEI